MPALESLPGKLGPYRLLEKIGEGGMGVVYLARDAENRAVAVKVLGAAVTDDPNARRRLIREVETMRRVRGPNVAEILDADVKGPSPYIVTRYVPGRSLDNVVRNDGPLRGPALDRLAAGLASALASIHAAGVVHRDLKPGNVMLDDGNPVVIDFGIAHVPDSTRLTQTGMVMGTPGYLAPEVIEGQPSSGAADVHSWGATVAFAATGRQPYGSGSYQTIFYRVLQGKPELTGIPPSLMPLVIAALRVDPRARPTAQSLVQQCAALDGCAALAGGGFPGRDTRVDGTRADGTLLNGARANGKRPPSIPVPWRRRLNRSSAGPAGPAYPPAPPSPPPSGYQVPPSPVAAAPDVADLLPPVDYARPGAPPGAQPRARAAAERAAPTAGHGLVSLAFGVGAVALAVWLPIAGTLLALAVITLLRAADQAQTALTMRRSVRGARPSDILIVIISAPWTVVRAVLSTVVLAPLALVVAGAAAAASVPLGHTHTLPEAGSWAAGAAVAWYCVGPGSRRPRRQLRRMTNGVIRNRAAMFVAVIACWALAAAIVSSALSQPTVIWPATSWMLPHLPSLGSALHSVQQSLLRDTVGVLHRS